MGTVQLYIGTSIDGFIADADGGVGWLEAFLVEGEDYGYAEFMSRVGAIVMGATSYGDDLGRGEWPYGPTPTWVFTHRELPRPPTGTVHLTRAPIPDVLAEIRATTGDNVFLVGGANLVRQFLAHDAIDELILTIAPVLLGTGTPLFDQAPRSGAQLLEARKFETGLVQLRYALKAGNEG